IRAGFVRRSVPLGASARARPLYEIADTYLAFWFSVIYSEAAHVGAGQKRQALDRRREEWQKQLGRVFEALACDHARRLVEAGTLPDDLVIGPWWSSSGPSVEVDVMGMRGTRTALLGEARWQARPLGLGDLSALQ